MAATRQKFLKIFPILFKIFGFVSLPAGRQGSKTENFAMKFIMQEVLKIFGIIILIIYLIFLGASAIKRNFVWQEPVLFYEDILRYNQKSLRIWNNLGMEHAEIGEMDKAIEAYKKAIELDVENQSAAPHHNLANAYRSEGMLKEAEEEYKKAIAIDKKFYFSYANLASLYLKNKQYNEAISVLKRELEIFPNDFQIQLMLDEVYKISR